MLLGWHYSDYYSNAYAMNQYLASRGYVVLSINYRLGIGYGYEFHRPPKAGSASAIGAAPSSAARRIVPSSLNSITAWERSIAAIWASSSRTC